MCQSLTLSFLHQVGLLIGPRGNTLKKMESESGAKIAIRGKGSVKEGKGRSDAAHTSNQEEDLHCLIMADTEEKVNKAKDLIHNVIETAASIPEGQNELKRNQLRELAALNGTLRDDENQACQNCKSTLPQHCSLLIVSGGQIGHRKYDCPEQRNFTANIICRVCGNAGHMARDCPERQRGSDSRNNVPGSYGGPPRGRPGPGDAVDREMEVSIKVNFSFRALTFRRTSCKNSLATHPTVPLVGSKPLRVRGIRVIRTVEEETLDRGHELNPQVEQHHGSVTDSKTTAAVMVAQLQLLGHRVEVVVTAMVVIVALPEATLLPGSNNNNLLQVRTTAMADIQATTKDRMAVRLLHRRLLDCPTSCSSMGSKRLPRHLQVIFRRRRTTMLRLLLLVMFLHRHLRLERCRVRLSERSRSIGRVAA